MENKWLQICKNLPKTVENPYGEMLGPLQAPVKEMAEKAAVAVSKGIDKVVDYLMGKEEKE